VVTLTLKQRNQIAVIFDFAWDDQAELGVWVAAGADAVCVEASICEDEPDEAGFHVPTGEYVLAGACEFAAGDGVILRGSVVLRGAEARAAWDYRARLASEAEAIDNGRGVGGVPWP